MPARQHAGEEINASSVSSKIFTMRCAVAPATFIVVPKGPKNDIYFRIRRRLKLWYNVEDARAEAVVAVVKGRGLNSTASSG